jgi:hypothetical protein
MSTRNEYITKMKLQLDELNATMAKLETKAQAATDDARELYKEEMRKLRHQSKLAVAKLDELKASSEAGWEAMVTEMEKMQDAFAHSFHYFKSQLQKNPARCPGLTPLQLPLDRMRADIGVD